MADREKVVKGLEYCDKYFNCCDKCPYWDGGAHCTADLAHDALCLLKEQPELVRCKDCEHSEEWYGDKRRCFMWHESGIDVFEDGFCNYGKRKQLKG